MKVNGQLPSAGQSPRQTDVGKVRAVSETKDFAKVIDVSESEAVSRDEETEDELLHIIKRMQRRRFQRVNKFQMIMKLSLFCRCFRGCEG